MLVGLGGHEDIVKDDEESVFIKEEVNHFKSFETSRFLFCFVLAGSKWYFSSVEYVEDVRVTSLPWTAFSGLSCR